MFYTLANQGSDEPRTRISSVRGKLREKVLRNGFPSVARKTFKVLRAEQAGSYILLAKSAVENYIKEKKIISPPETLPKEFLTKKFGTFVTIEKNGHLRGCIGTYLPTKENIAKEIIANSIAAATEDYRFGPIREEELFYLSYAVYILNKPEQIKDIKVLNPKKYGIIVKSQGFSSPDVIFDPAPRPYQKSGLLLPDLEGVDTVQKQISTACRKGGIDPQKEKIIIYKFSVEKYK